MPLLRVQAFTRVLRAEVASHVPRSRPENAPFSWHSTVAALTKRRAPVLHLVRAILDFGGRAPQHARRLRPLFFDSELERRVEVDPCPRRPISSLSRCYRSGGDERSETGCGGRTQPGQLLEALIAERPPSPDLTLPRLRHRAATTLDRAAKVGRGGGRVERSGVSTLSRRDHRSAAGAVDPGAVVGIRAACRRHRRLARRIVVRACGGRAARRGSDGTRSRCRQRPGARRRLGRASRRADRRARRSPCSARAPTSSIRREHESLAREIAATGRGPERTGAGHAAAAAVLPDAQPHHQRAVARGRGRRGWREERIAHHGALRARAGSRRAGRAWQHSERAQSRRPRPVARRCKDCGVGGRYSGGAGLFAPGASRQAGCVGPGSTAAGAIAADRVLACLAPGESCDLDAIAERSGLAVPACCPGCSSWSCRGWCDAREAAGSCGLTDRVSVKDRTWQKLW